MPIIKSSVKDVRRTKRRTERNSAEENKVRTAIKAVRSANTADEARQKLKLAMKTLDKAYAHGVLKRKNASRHISRLSSLVQNKFSSK